MSPLFTIGYQGATAEEFIACLKGNGVTFLVDVRERTASRKAGFSKSRLEGELAQAGIDYEHWRELGTPKPIRDLLRVGNDWSGYSEAYGRLLDERPEVLAALARRISAETACLMCFERDAAGCHRSLVAGRMQEQRLIDGVEHLVPSPAR